MALPLLARFRRPRQAAGETASPEAPRAIRRPAPAPGELRRERRALLRAREERLRDLGGLTLEMFRQDSFREHLLYEQCAEVAAMEERLVELELLLGARRPPEARCACGAPIFWGTHFCANCGRPVGDPVRSCSRCGHALMADAQFCPSCGARGTPENH